ncbi:uncharacterized protein LOC105424086 [Pogonomyrmex barbatus]|uniref:Uncharacterized protein LOC105424086 n=1 Tax=Pogonomyrmex barbatus TaxID=144034 RepID=A0A6I9VW59_9HYME|nr:uncharacterized protein LOC105424086 [Pogonomyrmex barbatus]
MKKQAFISHNEYNDSVLDDLRKGSDLSHKEYSDEAYLSEKIDEMKNTPINDTKFEEMRKDREEDVYRRKFLQEYTNVSSITSFIYLKMREIVNPTQRDLLQLFGIDFFSLKYVIKNKKETYFFICVQSEF